MPPSARPSSGSLLCITATFGLSFRGILGILYLLELLQFSVQRLFHFHRCGSHLQDKLGPNPLHSVQIQVKLNRSDLALPSHWPLLIFLPNQVKHFQKLP